jgi:basic amino acid/polyamine antiporter, APA family
MYNEGVRVSTLAGSSTTAAVEAPHQLRKVLGRRDVLGVAFGAMIGWGWVVLAGEMIIRAGSIGSILAFGVGAAMVLIVGLVYAELTSALSRAGGELSFVYVGLGPTVSFICGWTLVLAYLAVCAFEAVALPTVADYLVGNLELGYLWTVAGWDVHAAWVAIGVGGSLAIGLINYFGIRFASFVQWLAVGLLLLVGLSLFIPGSITGQSDNLAPLFTSWSGFLAVVIMMPFLFLGFDVVPQIAEEIKLPFKAVGRLIVFSILVALVWYAAVQWTVSLTLDDPVLAASRLPTADAMSAVYGSAWAGRLLVFGGLLGIVTSWNAFFIGSTRLLFAMSRGGMLPAIFSRLHPRYDSPVAAIALITGLSVLAPLFGRPVLVWLVNAGGLAAVTAYFLVAVSFIRIRRRYPTLPRPYTAPKPAFLGVAAVVATVSFILLYLPGSPSALIWPQEWVIVLAWCLLGVLFALGLRARLRAMGGEARQAERVLGDYVEVLQQSRD